MTSRAKAYLKALEAKLRKTRKQDAPGTIVAGNARWQQLLQGVFDALAVSNWVCEKQRFGRKFERRVARGAQYLSTIEVGFRGVAIWSWLWARARAAISWSCAQGR
jgi:hypothetical protein